jgi:hypothetical protein
MASMTGRPALAQPFYSKRLKRGKSLVIAKFQMPIADWLLNLSSADTKGLPNRQLAIANRQSNRSGGPCDSIPKSFTRSADGDTKTSKTRFESGAA